MIVRDGKRVPTHALAFASTVMSSKHLEQAPKARRRLKRGKQASRCKMHLSRNLTLNMAWMLSVQKVSMSKHQVGTLTRKAPIKVVHTEAVSA